MVQTKMLLLVCLALRVLDSCFSLPTEQCFPGSRSSCQCSIFVHSCRNQPPLVMLWTHRERLLVNWTVAKSKIGYCKIKHVTCNLPTKCFGLLSILKIIVMINEMVKLIRLYSVLQCGYWDQSTKPADLNEDGRNISFQINT